MLRLLTLASVAGIAAATKCDDVTNGLTCPANTAATGPVGTCAGAVCNQADRQVCCTATAGDFWITCDGTVTASTATCTGNKLAGGARITASTNTADATCAACTGTADFGPANGASDC